MSRSNPSANNPNPCARWFEWKGKDGKLVWYDKEKKETVVVPTSPNGFKFLVLDQLSAVTGYDKKKQTGIFSNEIRDSRADVLVVKFFKGGEIATGLWPDIKEKVVFNKGKFASSVYIAFKDGAELKIGNIRMSGCALGPWFDFVKKHRRDIDQKAVLIKTGVQDTSGSVDFIPPVFSIVDITPETDAIAKDLDQELQEFLAAYLKKPISQKLADHPEDENQESTYTEGGDEPEPRGKNAPAEQPSEDDVPW